MRVRLAGDATRSARVAVIPVSALDARLCRAWEAIRASNSELASPFFATEFIRLIGAARPDAAVAAIAVGNECTAFLPFHRDGPIGTAVAGPITDWAGLICRSDFLCDPRELAEECALAGFEFPRFLGSQVPFAPFHRSRHPNALIDLSAGFASYAAAKRAARSGLLKKCANLARQMARDIGPLRFVAHAADPAALQQVLDLKSAQYRRTGIADLFATEWLRTAIGSVHATQTADFAGMLSLLYAGDRLVAGSLGMRSRTVWHYHFPAYDPAAAKYSPGMNLLLRMIEYAPSAGLQTIDLGRAAAPSYKTRLMNRHSIVADVGVDCRAGGPL